MIDDPHPFPQLERDHLFQRTMSGDLPTGEYVAAILHSHHVRAAIRLAVLATWRAQREEMQPFERLNCIAFAEERFGRYGVPDAAWIEAETARQIAESDRLVAVLGAD